MTRPLHVLARAAGASTFSMRQCATSLHRRPSGLVAAVLLILVPGTVLSGGIPLLAQAPLQTVAQTADAGSSADARPAPQKLTIVILEGEGALNNIRERDAREPIVEVEDENHRPVAGALVLFASSDSSGGAGATFNTLTSLQVTTSSDGLAHATGFHPNRVPGHYALTVTATLGPLKTTILLTEVNFLGPRNSQPPIESSTSLPNQTPTSTESPASTEVQTMNSASRLGRLKHKVTTSQPLQWILAGALITGVVFTGIAATTGAQGTVITPGAGSVTAPTVLKAIGQH